MTQGKTILLLGAYGLAGQAILRALVYRGLSVAAAGRNEQKLLFAIEAVKTEFPESQVRPAVFDLQDEGALMRELASASVVINAVGPYLEHGEAIARMALESSTHYIDIASEQEHYRRLKRLSPSAASAGVFLGVGFGLYPGVSGILARQLLDRLEEPAGANLYLAMGPNPEGGGRAQLLTGILELTTRLQELLKGRLQRYTPSRTVEVGFASPFGKRNVLLWPQLEILSLSDHFDLEECGTGIYSPEQSPPTRFHEALTRLLSPQKRRWARNLLVSVAEKMGDAETDLPAPSGAALLVTAWSGDHQDSVSVYARDTERATAVLPALAAERLIFEEGGAVPLRGVGAALDFFFQENLEGALRDAGVEFKLHTDS